MGFLRRLAGFLGLGKEDGHEVIDEEDDGDNNGDGRRVDSQPKFHETGLPRKGFGVPVQVVVERTQPGPVLLPVTGDGGVQGLKWYSKRLRVDEDGDVADEFLDEVLPETLSNKEHSSNSYQMPRLEVKNNTRPAKVKRQALSSDGKFQQCIEFQGRLKWV